MNRRGFIGTLTALAGIVLAKIKAPAAPTETLMMMYTHNGMPLTVFTDKYVYVLDNDGLYKWQPTNIQKQLKAKWGKTYTRKPLSKLTKAGR